MKTTFKAIYKYKYSFHVYFMMTKGSICNLIIFGINFNQSILASCLIAFD